MSLTRELDKKDSPVTRWFAEHVVDIKKMSEEWNASLKATSLIRPEARPTGTVGTAFDYRLRYWFAVTPLEDLVASAGMRTLSLRATRVASRRGASELYSSSRDRRRLRPRRSSPSSAISSETSLERVPPAGRALDAADEQLLCRYCYLLALFKELFRGGLQIRSPLYTLRPGATADDLVTLAPPVWVDDLCALSTAFAPHYTALAGRPFVLNPNFAGSATSAALTPT